MLSTVEPQFVPIIPEQLAEGVLYICEQHHIVVHRCCCGCGEEVVTPLSQAEWQLERRGSVVSLYPSIGNWNYRCQSHYWIKRNRVVLAGALSAERVALLQVRDRAAKAAHIAELNALKELAANGSASTGRPPRRKAWDRLWAWIKWF
jgi:hypothetical protein